MSETGHGAYHERVANGNSHVVVLIKNFHFGLISPDTGMSYFLPRVVGYSRACDLIFTSRFVEAEEAYRIGLLDRLVEAEVLLHEAIELARQIAAWPPVAMQAAKRVLQQSMASTFEEQLYHESYGLQFARRAPHDVQESRASFLERRPPHFTGQ